MTLLLVFDPIVGVGSSMQMKRARLTKLCFYLSEVSWIGDCELFPFKYPPWQKDPEVILRGRLR